MTIREFQALAESIGEKGDYISTRVEISHGEIEFSIWSGNEAEFFHGHTPEAALDLFRKKESAPVNNTDMEITIPSIEVPPPINIEARHEESDPLKDMPF